MDIGFTGTRAGMTEAQRKAVAGLLRRHRPSAVRHGDCIGADVDFHGLALASKAPIIIHPPVNSSQRAFCTGAFAVRRPRPYLDRNHDIVDESDLMIATPKEYTDQPRGSGTWATIRYAKATPTTPMVIVWPDGSSND